MTRTLSFLVGASAALATIWTLAQLGIALAVGEVNVISLLGWGLASAILWALLRPIRWARAHGMHPGFHRR
jgi:hypothetical protein